MHSGTNDCFNDCGILGGVRLLERLWTPPNAVRARGADADVEAAAEVERIDAKDAESLANSRPCVRGRDVVLDAGEQGR